MKMDINDTCKITRIIDVSIANGNTLTGLELLHSVCDGLNLSIDEHDQNEVISGDDVVKKMHFLQEFLSFLQSKRILSSNQEALNFNLNFEEMYVAFDRDAMQNMVLSKSDNISLLNGSNCSYLSACVREMLNVRLLYGSLLTGNVKENVLNGIDGVLFNKCGASLNDFIGFHEKLNFVDDVYSGGKQPGRRQYAEALIEQACAIIDNGV